MIITYLRSSSYNTFAFCQMQYFFQYVLGYRDDANIKAEKGNVVHKALECIALSSLAKKDGKTEFVEDETGETLSVDDYDHYLEVGYEHYKGKSNHNWKKADWEECCEWYKTARESDFCPDKLDLIGPEQKFDFIIEKDWAQYELDGKTYHLGLKGTIDLAFKQDGLINIADWKTGRRVDWNKAVKKNWRWEAPEKTYEDLMKDPQILMYYYAACHLFGRQDMVFTILFINDGGPFPLGMGSYEYNLAESMIHKRFEEIRDCEFPLRIKPHDRCSWCKFNKSQEVWDADNKEWIEVDWTACNFMNYQINKKGIDKVTKLYGIDGAFKKYGDGGGRSDD